MKISEIPQGEGKTGQIGGKDVAVYNEGGKLFVFENVCPHAECQVEWNNPQKSWDCPCHGSRFKADGSLINGPATDPLPKLDFELKGEEIELK